MYTDFLQFMLEFNLILSTFGQSRKSREFSGLGQKSLEVSNRKWSRDFPNPSYDVTPCR